MASSHCVNRSEYLLSLTKFTKSIQRILLIPTPYTSCPFILREYKQNQTISVSSWCIEHVRGAHEPRTQERRTHRCRLFCVPHPPNTTPNNKGKTHKVMNHIDNVVSLDHGDELIVTQERVRGCLIHPNTVSVRWSLLSTPG